MTEGTEEKIFERFTKLKTVMSTRHIGEKGEKWF